MSEDAPQPEKKPLPNRRDSQPNTFYARAAAEARKMRRSMSRELLISYAKTLFWTIPLTILVWVYADWQQSKELDFQFAISAKIENAEKTVTVVEPSDSMIICRLRGPQSQIDALNSELSGRSPSQIVVPIDPKAPEKDNLIPTLVAIRDTPIFRSHGLTAVNVSSPVLDIYVDELKEKTVPTVAPDQMNGHTTVTFSPPTVTIRGPSRFLNDVQSVQADLSIPASGAPTTQQETVSLKPFREAQGITISPDSVEASIALAAPQASTVLPVIVYETLSPAIGFKYKIDVTPTRIPVNITGPEDVINKIKADPASFNIRAEMYLPGDAVNDSDPVPLQIIGLPDGVHVDSDTPLIVHIKVTPR